MTVTILGSNDAPIFKDMPSEISTTQYGVQLAQGYATLNLSLGASIFDPDMGNFNNGYLIVSSNLQVTNEDQFIIGNIANKLSFGIDNGQVSLLWNKSGSWVKFATLDSFYNGSNGVLKFSFNDQADNKSVSDLLKVIQYKNNSLYPSESRIVTYTIDDGSGLSNSASSYSFRLNVSNINDAPTYTSISGVRSDYVEQVTSPIKLFNLNGLSAVENSDSIIKISLKVENILDGLRDALTINGVQILLGQAGAQVVPADDTMPALTVSISLNGSTASIDVIAARGALSASQAQNLINNFSYVNLAGDTPSAGIRTFTLLSIQDSGGVANNGLDTKSVNISSSVNVVPVNDAPRISLNYANPSALSDSIQEKTISMHGYSSLFSVDSANVSAVESNQSITSINVMLYNDSNRLSGPGLDSKLFLGNQMLLSKDMLQASYELSFNQSGDFVIKSFGSANPSLFGVSSFVDAGFNYLSLTGNFSSQQVSKILAKLYYHNDASITSVNETFVILKSISDSQGAVTNVDASYHLFVENADAQPLIEGRQSSDFSLFTKNTVSIDLSGLDLLVKDTDDDLLCSVSISVQNSSSSAVDFGSLVLPESVTMNGITFNWDNQKHQLNLSGLASKTAYNDALDKLLYTFSPDQSNVSAETKTLKVVAVDSSGAQSNEYLSELHFIYNQPLIT